MDAVRQRVRREAAQQCDRRDLFSREIGAPTDSPSRCRAWPTRPSVTRMGFGGAPVAGVEPTGLVASGSTLEYQPVCRAGCQHRSDGSRRMTVLATRRTWYAQGSQNQQQDVVVEPASRWPRPAQNRRSPRHDQYRKCEALGRLPVSPSARSPARRPTAQGLRRQWASVPTVRADAYPLEPREGMTRSVLGLSQSPGAVRAVRGFRSCSRRSPYRSHTPSGTSRTAR